MENEKRTRRREKREGGGLERRVGSFAEILEGIPEAVIEGRYTMPVARQVLADYWLFVAQTRRRPTRSEFERRRPEWRGFFKSFRELERVTGRGGKKQDAVERELWGAKCGEMMAGRRMLNEPVNEQGVVLLFGEMAGELGFLIERVGTRFPNCVASRRVGGEWKEVRIEFEFLSSRFDHDPAGCDLVVCWEHDWKGCPVEVLELRSERGMALGTGH